MSLLTRDPIESLDPNEAPVPHVACDAAGCGAEKKLPESGVVPRDWLTLRDGDDADSPTYHYHTARCLIEGTAQRAAAWSAANAPEPQSAAAWLRDIADLMEQPVAEGAAAGDEDEPAEEAAAEEAPAAESTESAPAEAEAGPAEPEPVEAPAAEVAPESGEEAEA